MSNVLHIRDSRKIFGADKVIVGILNANYNIPVEFTVAAFIGRGYKDNPFLEEIKKICKTEEIIERGLLDVKIINQIVSIVKNNNIQVIHSHDCKSNFYALIAAKIARVPIVTTLHGWIANGYKQKLYVFIDKLLKRYFTKVIIVSESQGDLLKRYGVRKDQIVHVPNSINYNDYSKKHSSQNFRHEYNLSSQNILIGNIGRLSPEKGQKDFLAACQVVAEKIPDARFILIGEGPDLANLEKYTNDLGLDGKVIFTGYRGDMPNIYQSLDLVVLSSYTEGLPNVVLEAMAAEVPVIATQVGGVSELIDDGVTGILVKAGQPEMLASAIVNTLSNPAKMKRIEIKAIKNIKDKYSSEKSIIKTHQLYMVLARDAEDNRL